MFADKFKQILQQKNITCYKLAKLTGISQTALHRYILGQRQPTFENVDKIADVLCVPISYFSDYEPNLYTIFKDKAIKIDDHKVVVVPNIARESRILDTIFDLKGGKKCA